MNIQNKFKKTNTIYKITKDMDLEGSTLIIPVGCTLDFQGGSFKNGTIEGNGTAIQSELRKIFDDNVVLEGVWDIKEAYPEWFGGKGDGITDNTQAIKNCIKYFTNTYVSAGTYITNQIDDIPSFRTIRGCGKKSIIQANPSMELTNGYLLRTKDGGSGITFSDFVLLGGSNSTESNYKIGGIALRSTSNDVNDQWDTRNIIQNVEIKYCYAASIYVGTYQRENKISNCFITHTTNIGINCMGTDNMIIGCTVASSHHEGIVINGNNRVNSCKCFGCGASSTVTGKYALSLIGSKCNVSNVELQQNNYGGCIIQGNSNYVQITCDNNGSGTTNTVLGCHVVGSYNTVSVTSYNFSFHDNQYERYFVSTNWNTVGNNITVNGTPLQKNKMSALSPWSVDNICNNIMWNGYNITQSREVPFDKLVLPDLFRSNGTGSFYVNDSGLSFKLTSVTAVNVDALVQAISIHNSNAIDPDGCFSVKARFHKDGDIDTSVYPIIRVITRYKDSSGTTLTRVDQNTTVNLLDNKDSLDVYALTQYHYLSDKPASILSVSVEFAIRSTKLLSDVSINAYFDSIKIGATTSGNKVKFVNTNIDGTLASKVIIANKLSDFTQENTIYKITTDLNLNTAILELPADCTLDFQGGSISNGTIVGSDTKIKAGISKIFDTNVIIQGSWDLSQVYPEWFGAKGDNTTDNTDSFSKITQFGANVFISKGTYILNGWDISTAVSIIGSGYQNTRLVLTAPIEVHNNNNVNFEGVTVEVSDNITENLEYIVKVYSAYHFTANLCTFYGKNKATKGIYSYGDTYSYYHYINTCRFVSITNAIVLSYNSNASTINNNEFYQCDNCIVIDSCNGVRVENNTFQSYVYNGIILEYNNYGSKTWGNLISGNYFEGEPATAIADIDFTSNADCRNNTITGNKSTYITLPHKHILNCISENTIIETTNATYRYPTKLPGFVKLQNFDNDSMEAFATSDFTGVIAPRVLENGAIDLRVYVKNADGTYTWKSVILSSNSNGNQINIGVLNATEITQYSGGYIQLGYNASIGAKRLTVEDTTGRIKYSSDGQNWSYLQEVSTGNTANRPTTTKVGFMYFDTQLSKYICWNGTAWVNLDGTALT